MENQTEKEWEKFINNIDLMIKQMGDYKPDVIVPSMCGGLVPAGIVAEKLNIKDIRPISIERIGEERSIAYDVLGDLNGLNVLLLEDDMPTGKGFIFVKKEYEKRGAKVKIAAININSISEKVADFFGEKYDVLPNLPWKVARSVDRIVKKI
jgi:hypoxanthine phosphoribosyltransferase